jgi:hypothetical protein
MTIQAFNIYTANGYAGDLVDSGPRVVQTGILTSASAGFGLALTRDSLTVDRGVKLADPVLAGSTTTVYAISQREYNHEAGTRPSDGDDTFYYESESVSIIRDGYLYIKLTGSTAIKAGEVLKVDVATGEFNYDTASASNPDALNVIADEAALVGEVFKARILLTA